MSYTAKQLISLAEQYETQSKKLLSSVAGKKSFTHFNEDLLAKYGQSAQQNDPTWVKALQKFLSYKNRKPITIDGIFGPETSKALQFWQEHGAQDPWVTANGKLDTGTLQALKTDLMSYLPDDSPFAKIV
jgi:Putative peptidoglycan binding domain